MDFEERRLQDECPNCGQSYDFPLVNHPSNVGDYRIIEPLGRGFYAATFVAERQGLVRRKNVLKVVPAAVLEFFGKSFADECEAHANAATGASYLVGIDDAFDRTLTFAQHKMQCHVAVLEHLDGHLLQDYLSGEKSLSASAIAQVAADLFRIREELAARKINHNDFHAGNIIVQDLPTEQHRRNALHPSIRAVAIDFGSLAEDRRSGGRYLGDLHWIARHVETLSLLLMRNEGQLSDFDSRLALALRMIAQSIAPAIENQRIPSSEEIIGRIEEEFFRSGEPWRPWRKPLALRKFQESYNAQTLHSWNVPQLIVDPDNKWQESISSAGPLVITGMRGCGKTMLLRALEFHARAAQRGNETDAQVLDRVASDDYVGFFVSASSLLNLEDKSPSSTDNMFARLAVAYSLAAARSLAHLADLDPNRVHEFAPKRIQDLLASILSGYSFELNSATVQQLEHHLIDCLIQACRSESNIELDTHPSNAFPLLARAIRESSSYWSDSQVLFLLDDVSTRYLRSDQIEVILRALIFQNPECAFKQLQRPKQSS